MDGQMRWLEVQAEPGTCNFTLGRFMTLTDLNADGDCKLVYADIGGSQNLLKVLKGMSVVGETTLPELPSGVVSLFNDSRKPRSPIIAVASGPSIYLYRNLKPYYKFSLPNLEVNALEVDLWLQVRDAGMEARALYDMLASLQQDVGYSQLSQQSQQLLMLGAENDEELRAHVTAAAPHPLTRRTVITCVSSLRRSTTDPDGISCLVLGSEDGAITFVDTEAFSVIEKVDQWEDYGSRTIPTSLQTSGLLDVEFRVIICNRDGKITQLRRGWKHSKILVQLAQQPVDIIFLDNGHLVVATHSSLECYSKKGRQQWEEQLSGEAIEMTKIPLEHQGITLVAVAIKGGQVSIYSGRHLVDVISAPESVTAMTFGRFGQEEHCLILVTTGGTLLVKLLKRTAQFTPTTAVVTTNTLQKLPIPKRTRLLVEQVALERQNAIEIHQGFQRGLFHLRLLAARNLAESIHRSSNLISSDNKLPLKISAQVFGLGPTFKIRLTVDNMAGSLNQTIPPLHVCVHFNHALYQVSKPYLDVPHLVPGLVYNLETVITAVGDLLISEDVQIFLVAEGSSKPLLSATVHIPVCDLLPIEI